MSGDLDPRWEWYEDRRLCDPAPTYVKGACNHLEAVPVESHIDPTVVLAHLCLNCDQQLPAEWKPDPAYAPPTTAELHVGIDYDDPIDEYRQHHRGA
jgi:hypothetical protein